MNRGCVVLLIPPVIHFLRVCQTIPLLELNSSLWEGNGEEAKLTLMQKKKRVL